MTLNELNQQSCADATTAFSRCCGASRWISQMVDRRPFADEVQLHAVADVIWSTMERADILEAFSHHPQIGADVESLRKKFAATATWSAGEQASVAAADESTLAGLAAGNQVYRQKFGYLFIVCASGKSAAEMLSLLQSRLMNDADTELRIAAGEQAQIMHLRLVKLLEP